MKKELNEVSEEASPMGETPDEVEEMSQVFGSGGTASAAGRSSLNVSQNQNTAKRASKKSHSARRSLVSEFAQPENESIRCWNQR